jgi:hypothetical protein
MVMLCLSDAMCVCVALLPSSCRVLVCSCTSVTFVRSAVRVVPASALVPLLFSPVRLLLLFVSFGLLLHQS